MGDVRRWALYAMVPIYRYAVIFEEYIYMIVVYYRSKKARPADRDRTTIRET